jgi:hypothetical protein
MDHLEDPGICERIILKWIFRKWMEGHRLDLTDSALGKVVTSCKHGNEVSIKCGEFLE